MHVEERMVDLACNVRKNLCWWSKCDLPFGRIKLKYMQNYAPVDVLQDV